MATSTILIAEDHLMLRDGLREIIESQPDLKVVCEAANGREAVELASRHSPQVVIMDISMQGLNGIDATRRIVTANPTVRVIGLSAHVDRRFVQAMIDAGASGYLAKSAAGDELVRAIRTVLTNQKFFCSAAAGVMSLTHNGRQFPGSVPLAPSLTDREREILQLLAEGNTSRDIAKDLRISSATVDVHRKNIMKKLNLHSIAELTKHAIREGLTSA
jgi:DNA-binding NarL/FixJ family response regulator